MIYLITTIFTLISIVVIVMLFDRQLYGRVYQKADHAFQYLWVLKARYFVLKPQVITNIKPKIEHRFLNIKSLNMKVSNVSAAVIPTLSILVIVATTVLCYFLVTHNSLEVYRTQSDAPNTANAQINQLLIGEQLHPPPSPPAELFAELEAEIASYQATQMEAGKIILLATQAIYWPHISQTVILISRMLTVIGIK